MKTQPTLKQSDQPVGAGFADGFVVHSRVKPKIHRFKYQMCWCLFDLDRLDDWFSGSKLWRHNSWALYSLFDKDYISTEKRPIKQKLITFINQKNQNQFNGRVVLFTHPRFLGYGFNSVSFYFCYQLDKQGEYLAYIVTEINNTPWGEKHLYLHDCNQSNQEGSDWAFEFEKKFHISPFMDMQMNYRWEFKVSAEQVAVKMWVKKQSETLLTVVLDTKITPFVENINHSIVLRKPFQPWKMSAAIYWQAFKLWCKKIPFFDHPKNNNNNQ